MNNHRLIGLACLAGAIIIHFYLEAMYTPLAFAKSALGVLGLYFLFTGKPIPKMKEKGKQ